MGGRTALLLFLLALVAFALGVWVTPDRLAGLGIMDVSIHSPIALVRETTLLEISIVKTALQVLAFISLGIGLAWPRIEKSPRYRTFMERDWRFGADYEAVLRRFVSADAVLLFTLIALSFLYLLVGEDILSREQLRAINREDGVIETSGACIFFLASVLAVMVAYKSPPGAIRYMHALLALVFFLMAGEEISWGQRIFELDAPEVLAERNVQGELNLHNMFGYFFDHTFIFSFLVWGCVVPVLDQFSQFFRNLFRRFGLPVPSFGLAVGMLLITAMQEQIISAMHLGIQNLRVAELREFLSAAAFVALMQQSYRCGIWKTAEQVSDRGRKAALKA